MPVSGPSGPDPLTQERAFQRVLQILKDEFYIVDPPKNDVDFPPDKTYLKKIKELKRSVYEVIKWSDWSSW